MSTEDLHLITEQQIQTITEAKSKIVSGNSLGKQTKMWSDLSNPVD
jgi:hypothetical protein